ncbi:MAG: lipopolysaccharide kinase InaA family protein [Planctomycetota bacterium]
MRWWWSGAPDEATAALARDLEADRPVEGLRAIKASDRRSVDALPGVSGGLLLKVFQVRDREALKYRIVPSRARAEYSMARSLARRGVPVPDALGYGEQRDGRRLVRAWFIGRLIPDAPTVGDAMRAAAERGDADRVQSLARDALAVVATLHHHPFLHRDLHANNLLLSVDDRMLLTDLHSVWRVPRLTRSMRVGNLARLLCSMRGALDLDHVGELIREHAARTRERVEPFVLDVRAAVDAFDRNYLRGRTARCLKPSTLFMRDSIDGERRYHRREYTAEVFDADRILHDEALAAGGAAVLGHAPASRVTRVGDEPGRRVVKEYTVRGMLPAWRQRLGLGRARSAWKGARRLEVLGIPTPRTLALHERSDGSALLVTESLGDPPSLRNLAEHSPAGIAPARRAALARALGNVVGRLARAGIRHDDLSSKNVLVVSSPAPSSRDVRTQPDPDWPSVHLIDLDNMTTMPPHDAHGMQRMLSQLCDLPDVISRTDRLRFLRAYAAASGRALPRSVGEASLAGARARAARRAAARPAPA